MLRVVVEGGVADKLSCLFLLVEVPDRDGVVGLCLFLQSAPPVVFQVLLKVVLLNQFLADDTLHCLG